MNRGASDTAAGREGPSPPARAQAAREQRQRLKLSLRGVSTHIIVRCRRRPGARGTVICAPGLAASGAEFCVLATRLSGLGFDVICPDWLGHGDSDYPDDETAYRWDSYVKTLGIVHRVHGGDDTHFLGVSWGAVMAFLLLISNPIKPRSAIFVDLPLRDHPDTARSYVRLLKQCETSFDSFEEAESFLYALRPELARMPETMRAYYRAARFAQRGGKVRFKCDPRSVRAAASGADARFNYLPAIRRISFDSLFLYGSRSPYRDPAAFSAVCRDMRHIRYADGLDGGHPPTLLSEDQILPIESFLTRQTSAA